MDQCSWITGWPRTPGRLHPKPCLIGRSDFDQWSNGIKSGWRWMDSGWIYRSDLLICFYFISLVFRGPCSILPAVLHVYMLRRHFILLPNLFNRTIAFDIDQYMLLPERPNIPRNATNCVKPYIYWSERTEAGKNLYCKTRRPCHCYLNYVFWLYVLPARCYL